MRLPIFILFIFVHISLFSQKNLKWGKIPATDLAMTVYEPDTTAAAVVLNETGELILNFINGKGKYQLEVLKRIKILKRSGFDQGNISIPYYSYNGSGKISTLKVHVISPSGEKVELDKKEIFDNKISEYYSEKKFAVPNLEVGSVIEYKFTEYKENIFSLRPWYFQYEIPVRSSHYRLKIPDWYKYVPLFTGGPVESAPIEYSVETIAWSAGGARGGMANIPVDIEQMHFYVEDMPAMKEEAFITTMKDYRAQVQFQLSSVEFPNTPIDPVLRSWKSAAKGILERNVYRGEINSYSSSLKAANDILASKETLEEKVFEAYNFVQENIQWNSFYSDFPNKTLNSAFKLKKGNSADINLSVLAILKNAGIDAHPLIVSTRSHGRPIEVYPIISQFNHVMVYVKNGENSIILDATNRFRPMGIPSINSLNKRGFLVEEKNPRWINLIPPKSSDTYLLTASLDEEGALNGNLAVSCSGYSSYRERAKIARAEEDDNFWEKRLEDNYPDAEVSNVSHEGLGIYDKKLKTKMDCKIPDAAQVNGDFIYFSPWLYGGYDENPFKLEERNYPVEIPYPDKEQFILNLTIPEGYAVEDLPESVKMALPGNGGKFQYLVTEKENSIQVICKVSILQLQFFPSEYEIIKTFFDQIIKKKGEQIVLKKV